jgi:hypothetical protein
MSIQADGGVERNITSSDIEFLEGEEGEVLGKVKTKKMKAKPESTRMSIDNARRALVDVNTDLSAKRKATNDGNDKE